MLGVLLGGISGLYGGWIDTRDPARDRDPALDPDDPAVDGAGRGAARHWRVTQVYFAITIIISLIGWTELARVVRGRFLALREEDFVIAAELAGASQMRIIFRHMVPSFCQPHHRRDQPGAAGDDHQRDVAVASWAWPAAAGDPLGRPAAGRAERPGAGQRAVAAVAAVPVIIVILAFNFLGDGLRDAADPYG